MGKFTVEVSTTIKSPAQKIFPLLNDLRKWDHWSPWKIMEPEATTTFSDDGKHQKWEGRRIGHGNQQITSEEKDQKIQYDLEFIKPWKSKSKSHFVLKSTNEKETEVTWGMESKLPFYLFSMKSKMVAMIKMDFQRGLRMLKEYAEDGEVLSKLEFVGEKAYPGCDFVGITKEIKMEELSEVMEGTFADLFTAFKGKEDSFSGPPFSIYHKWDIVKGVVRFTCGIPFKTLPETINEGMVSESIPPTKVYTLRHIGSYKHLGNAWSTGHSQGRSKEFKVNKNIHPFEMYVNDLRDTKEKDIVTEICLPIY